MRRASLLLALVGEGALLALLAANAGGETQAPTPPAVGDVRVTVMVLGPDRRPSPAPQAIVWISEGQKPGSLASSSAHPRVASKSKRFDPRITAVPAGTTVDFPNLDGIFHNVFSLSPGAKFDLGLYRNGASRAMTFDNPGLVRVYCNIHPQMAAYLMVIDGTIWAQTGSDGNAVLASVPAGRAVVRAWDEKGGDYQGTVDVTAGKSASLAIALDGSSWREPPHTNKYGKKYPPPDDDANRY
ncbi:MAG: cupredoxin domain-containing protein [Thermoanaerobaculia bacterium]